MGKTILQELAGFAAELGAEAGRMAGNAFGTAEVSAKSDGSEVTSADLAVQDMLTRRILERHPDHAIVAEERLSPDTVPPDPGRAPYCWVIDPIDGTRNYARRFPVFATSIAVMEHGTPVVGVIRWHHTGQLFVATADGPAELDGVSLQASLRPLDTNLLVGAQLGAHHATQDVVVPWLRRWAVRNLGATAIHLALVASGGLDIAYAKDCRIWDMAAGALLIERAGGACTDLDGGALFPVDMASCAEANYPFFAGGPQAHPALLEQLAKHVRNHR
ncbi:MAG: inositol monophosphatase [bacterium]|nr:inositol monophosphatase [bacterium]